MKGMVAGFLIDDRFNFVLLIEKNRPKWQAGFCNGVGGKIEEGETPMDAMRREFREETGHGFLDWSQFATLSGEGDWQVHFFVGVCQFSTIAALPIDRTAAGSDEVLRVVPVKSLVSNGYTLPNVEWLVPLAVTVAQCRDRCSLFEIREAA